MIRSILAVLAGIAVLTVTSFGIEAVATPLMMRVFPQALPNQAALGQNAGARLFMLAYTMLCVAAGGYVTAWLARSSRVRHAVIMGALEAAMTVWVVATLPGHGPLWPGIAAIVLIVPAAWSGGAMAVRRASVAVVQADGPAHS